MRQFSVGEVVTWVPDLLLRWETHGDYRIVAAMPDRDGHHVYRVKSPLEEYERAVKEDLLAKSNGYLPEPEEVPARVSRRSSITLPTRLFLATWRAGMLLPKCSNNLASPTP